MVPLLRSGPQQFCKSELQNRLVVAGLRLVQGHIDHKNELLPEMVKRDDLVKGIRSRSRNSPFGSFITRSRCNLGTRSGTELRIAQDVCYQVIFAVESLEWFTADG